MRKTTVVLLFAVMLMIALAVPAVAATQDTKSQTTEATLKLNALGILKGYPDGSLRLGAPMTRAELAAVAVRVIGQDGAARLLAGRTRFCDVDSSHWASGYINVAAAAGIIIGDPDGHFRPDASVSYAEAVTMLIRIGGWDRACSRGDWPAEFIVKAVQLGLVKGVSFSALAALTRADAAEMVYNSLGAPLAVWDKAHQDWVGSAVTVLNRYLKGRELFTTVIGVPATDGSLASSEVATADGRIALPAGIAANALLGRSIDVITVDGRCVYVRDVTPASAVVAGVSKENLAAGAATISIRTAANDTEFKLAPGAVIIRNNVPGGLGDISAGDRLVLFLDEENAVRFIAASHYDVEDAVVTAKTVRGSVGAEDDSLVTGGHSYRILPNTVFSRNGEPANFGDIAVGDVVYVQATGEYARAIEAFGPSIRGVVGGVGYNTDGRCWLTVNGVQYVVDPAAFSDGSVQLDGEARTQAEIGGLVGHNAEVTLNRDGEARIVRATSETLFGAVEAVSEDRTSFAVLSGGLRRDIAMAYGIVPAGILPGDRVKVCLRANGQATRVSAVTLSNEFSVRAVDTVNRRLTLERAGALQIMDYAFDACGSRGAAWGAPALLEPGDRVMLYSDPTTGVMRYFEAWPDQSGIIWGKMIGSVTTDSGTTVYADVRGSLEEYPSAVVPALSCGDFARLILDSHGVVSAVDPVQWLDGGRDYRIVALSGSVVTVAYEDGGTKYALFDLSRAALYRAGTGAFLNEAELQRGMVLRVATSDGGEQASVEIAVVVLTGE